MHPACRCPPLQGQWIVQLDPVGHSLLPVSYTASVSGSVSPNTLTFRDVVFGDGKPLTAPPLGQSPLWLGFRSAT